MALPQEDPKRLQDPRTPDWSKLVERVQAGDTEAIEQLYALFARGIRFLLLRQLGPEELEDKVHDVFLVVLQAIRRGQLRDPQRLTGFVWAVVRNHIPAYIRKIVEQRDRHMDLQFGLRLCDNHNTPEEDAIARQRTEIMARALQGISQRDREVLTRFYLLGESLENICSEMRLTQTQFRLLKSRAKARFSEQGRRALKGRRLRTVFSGAELDLAK